MNRKKGVAKRSMIFVKFPKFMKIKMIWFHTAIKNKLFTYEKKI
jgi:hypothetical protein